MPHSWCLLNLFMNCFVKINIELKLSRRNSIFYFREREPQFIRIHASHVSTTFLTMSEQSAIKACILVLVTEFYDATAAKAIVVLRIGDSEVLFCQCCHSQASTHSGSISFSSFSTSSNWLKLSLPVPLLMLALQYRIRVSTDYFRCW